MSFSLIKRQERCTLTWCGRLLVAVLLVTACLFAAVRVYPFLAVTDRVPARVLVVDGWMQANYMRRAIKEFHTGKYDRVLLIKPLLDAEDQNEPCRNWVVSWFVQQGVTKEQMALLYPKVTMKDRTYHSALAVKEWLKEHGLSSNPINVITQGPHARRSGLLYQKVFGDNLKVGIIGLRNLDYDPAHWWRTSAGVREVIGESIAYLYVRFFFNPMTP